MRNVAFGILAVVAVTAAIAPAAAADYVRRPPAAPVVEALPDAIDVAPPRWEGLQPILCADGLGASPCAPPCAPACPPPCAPCGCNPWQVDVSVFLWLGGLDGTVTAHGVSSDVDVTPMDVLENLDLIEATLAGSVRVSHGRWFARATGYYARIGDDLDLAHGANPDVQFEQWILEGAVGYRVAEVPLSCDPCGPTMSVSPYVGVRYDSLALTIDTVAGSIDQTKCWADPIVGVELGFDFKNCWWARVAGDVGGFGLGGDTDTTWSVRGEVGYQFSRNVGAFVGFAAIDSDYEDGDFRWDVTQYGPYLGLRFSF